MRALVIAMVLSVMVSGGAFATAKEGLGIKWDIEKVKASEDECKDALFEGQIIANGKHGWYNTITIAYEDHVFIFSYSEGNMSCDKLELVLDD